MGNLIVKHRIVLDLARRGAQVTVPVTKADKLSHQIIVTLRCGTETVELPDGTRAAIAIHNNADGTGVLDSCIVDHVNNAVIYTYSAPALSVAGNIACDITVFDKDGAALGTPRLNLFVEDTGADVTEEQLKTALQAEGSSWTLVQDVYANAEAAAKSADDAAAEAAKLSGYQKEILDKLEADYVDRTTFNGTVDNLATLEAVQNVREVAEGKCACYTADKFAEVQGKLSLTAYSGAPTGSNIYRVGVPTFDGVTPLRTGDVILIAALNVPDFWYDGTKKALCPLETTKVDLTGYLKMIKTTSSRKRVYGVAETGVNTLLECSTGRGVNTIALRDANGRLAASDPTDDIHCVPLGFGDNRYLFRTEVDQVPTAASEKLVTSGGLYNAFIRARAFIDGKRLDAGETDKIGITDYGEYLIYGSGATVKYTMNSSFTEKTYTGKIHLIILYTTWLDDKNSKTQFFHATVGDSILSLADVQFGNLQSDIEIIADKNTYFAIKRAYSGTNSTPVIPVAE